MPKPRHLLVDTGATPYYHLINRCVRRAFLCGRDEQSGRNFDHRKQWLVDRMKELCRFFTIDVCAYACLSNHFHLVVRVDSERCHKLADDEVQGRYGALFPEAAKRLDGVSEPDRTRLLETWRERLGDLSWYMRCLNEYIARRANREDDVTGRFWEGRFRSQALLDEGALLTCMSYVDLNPIRAGIAGSLEESEFTSILERLQAFGPAGKTSSPEGTPGRPTPAKGATGGELVPFLEQGVTPGNAVGRWTTHPIPIGFEDYVVLLRETARLIAEERSGGAEITGAGADVLQRVDLCPSGFLDSIRHYSTRFFTMVGQTHRIDAECERRRYRRRPGRPAAAKLYRQVA